MVRRRQKRSGCRQWQFFRDPDTTTEAKQVADQDCRASCQIADDSRPELLVTRSMRQFVCFIGVQFRWAINETREYGSDASAKRNVEGQETTENALLPTLGVQIRRGHSSSAASWISQPSRSASLAPTVLLGTLAASHGNWPRWFRVALGIGAALPVGAVSASVFADFSLLHALLAIVWLLVISGIIVWAAQATLAPQPDGWRPPTALRLVGFAVVLPLLLGAALTLFAGL